MSDPAVSTELATIERIMVDDRRSYNRDEPMQARYRELVARRDGADNPAAPAPDWHGTTLPVTHVPADKAQGWTPAGKSAAEVKAFAEHLMKTDRRAYNANESLQAAYRQALRGQAPGEEYAAKPAQAVSVPDPAWTTAAGREVLAAWDRNGGIARNWSAVQSMGAEIQDALPADTRAEFVSQWDGLPAEVHAVAYAEISNPVVRGVVPATGEAVAKFAETDHGKILAPKWGAAAPRKLAVALARAGRVADKLSDEAANSFAYFVEHVSAQERAALLDFLARAA